VQLLINEVKELIFLHDQIIFDDRLFSEYGPGFVDDLWFIPDQGSYSSFHLANGEEQI
jgi:hypothetical protein